MTVVDTGNGMISHSEGQGYGMVLAVAAGDRAVFDRIWSWTRANLMVRDDELLAWRWEPAQRPAVADMNDASDGDMLVAWALTEAAEMWGDVSYRVMARRMAVEIGRKVVIVTGTQGKLLLPAIAGFSAQERGDGPVINLSYWVFPALARLSLVAPEIDWSGLSQNGLDLLKKAQFGAARLPSDWIAAPETGLRPADGFAPRFGYNAIRIPLYMAWAGIGGDDDYTPFVVWARNRRTALPVVDVATGRAGDTFGESGYGAVASLLVCLADQAPLSADVRMLRPSDAYYPSTLQMLVLLAAQMRYPSCVRG
jgi:endoglucanase